MATKSVIQIELDDAPWKNFQKEFKAHTELLNKLPGQWGAVGKSISGLSGAAGRFTASIAKAATEFKKADTSSGKLLVALRSADKVTTSLARNTFNLARNLAEATKSLLSWGALTGLISGVLGAGGLFGITRMNQGVAERSGEAKRTNSTYNGSAAVDVAYGALADTNAMMEKINESKQSGGVDLMKLERYGLKTSDWKDQKDTSKIVYPLLAALQKMQQTAPEGIKKYFAETFASGFMTFPQLTGLGNETKLDSMRELEGKARKDTYISPQNQANAAEFLRIMKLQSESLTTIFMNAVGGKLNKPLEHLGASFVNLIRKGVNSKEVEGLINATAKGVDQFASYLESGKFSSDLKDFVTGIQQFADRLFGIGQWIADSLGIDFRTPKQKAKDESAAESASFIPLDQRKTLQSEKDRLQQEQNERERKVGGRAAWMVLQGQEELRAYQAKKKAGGFISTTEEHAAIQKYRNEHTPHGNTTVIVNVDNKQTAKAVAKTGANVYLNANAAATP